MNLTKPMNEAMEEFSSNRNLRFEIEFLSCYAAGTVPVKSDGAFFVKRPESVRIQAKDYNEQSKRYDITNTLLDSFLNAMSVKSQKVISKITGQTGINVTQLSLFLGKQITNSATGKTISVIHNEEPNEFQANQKKQNIRSDVNRK